MKPVLYAEDNPDDVFLLRLIWERAGIPNPLMNVADGQEAVEYLSGTGKFTDREKYPLPCLLLLDLKMPGMGGFDVLQWVRRHPDLKTLKVVITSGSNLDEDLQHARSLGITDYVVKSPRLKNMLELVQEKKKVWLENGEV